MGQASQEQETPCFFVLSHLKSSFTLLSFPRAGNKLSLSHAERACPLVVGYVEPVKPRGGAGPGTSSWGPP